VRTEREPRAYTPRHLADKILQSKSALEGERKQVTVLFADVKGSMELAEQVDPEEWHAILDRFFEILTDGVHRFEGTVNQYTGDGIMALFGAPIAHEDHAQRACYAALHLRDALRGYADELRRRGLNFSVRMGLNSGDVIVGKIGPDLRMDYTAQGHTVGLAQRMEQSAETGCVYLAEQTARLVEGYFRLRHVGEFDLPGVREPQRVCELEGVGRHRTRLELAGERGFSRFVGRARELGVLQGAREQALRGTGRVVGVVGEAGVGKSRLCAEFVERCRAEGVDVYEAHCPAHGKTMPFLVLLELLRSLFGLTERDTDRETRQRIAGTVLLLDESFRELLPLLFDFLGVPDPERPAPSMDPEARQRQLFGFVRRLVQARSVREPMLILVDDLHWIDPASDAFLAQLVEAVQGTRTLLLVNFRPEYQARWTSRSYYEQLPLAPLGADAVRELLDDLLGRDESLASLPALIHERTGGNPFFVEEVVQSLAESGHLAGQRGAHRLERPIHAVEIPGSVEVVLGARIDRLPEREKQVLQRAAVIGREFAGPVLERIAELPSLDLAAALDALQASEFVHEKALYPEASYAFKHPLTHEVALRSQLADRCAQIHAATARALEQLRAERLDEDAALIAHHWAEAGEAHAAARWYRRAAEWAGSSDALEADRHWQRVIALLEPLPRTAETDSLLITATTRRIDLGWRVGMAENEAEAAFSKGERLARESGELRGLAILQNNYAFLKGEYNQFEEQLAHSRSALELAESLGDVSLQVAVARAEVRALIWLGRIREGEAIADRALALAEGDPRLGSEVVGGSPYLWLLVLKAGYRVWAGRPGEALSIFERADRLAHELDDLEALAIVNSNRMWPHFVLGDPESALGPGRKAVEIAERIGGALLRADAAALHGFALAATGDWRGASAAVERVHAITAESRVALEWQSWTLILLCAVRLGQGDFESARELGREAVRVFRERGIGLCEMLTLYYLTRALLRPAASAELDEAEACLSQGIERLRASGVLALEPLMREEAAELARLRGDLPRREHELREAHRLFVEMGASAHAERVARELGS
jgi:class 3 adenylate cyclase/tetratricopeptide (TPR) repeat protein